MADYHYVSTWQLQAPIEQVWAALNDLEHLPVWYRGVQQAQELTPGDAQGIGRRVRYVIKGRLPLRLAFEVQPPGRIPRGTRNCRPRESWPAPGTGHWTSRARSPPPATAGMCATRPWMNLLSPLARPLFTWNSRGVMLQAGEGLARFLDVPLVAAEFTPHPG